jgi:hypothetical protein
LTTDELAFHRATEHRSRWLDARGNSYGHCLYAQARSRDGQRGIHRACSRRPWHSNQSADAKSPDVERKPLNGGKPLRRQRAAEGIQVDDRAVAADRAAALEFRLVSRISGSAMIVIGAALLADRLLI